MEVYRRRKRCKCWKKWSVVRDHCRVHTKNRSDAVCSLLLHKYILSFDATRVRLNIFLCTTYWKRNTAVTTCTAIFILRKGSPRDFDDLEVISGGAPISAIIISATCWVWKKASTCDLR